MKQDPKEKALYRVLCQLDSPKGFEAFFRDLCTPAERKAMAERWEVAQWLHRGSFSYREIHARTGASLVTIARVARFLKDESHGGYQSVLDPSKTLSS